MSTTSANSAALRQLPKLKSLLKKYRQFKTMQASLLQLSELASTVTEMASFYPALVDVINTLLTTDSLHISLLNKNGELEVAYCNSHLEPHLLASVAFQDWRKSLTGLVFNQQKPLHCSAAERMALARAEKIALYGSSCVDWLGIPLKRNHQVIGVIALQSYDESLYFDDRDCQLLEFIAEHIVTAIDRVSSRELLEQAIQQRTRKLTEINRRLQQEIAERQKVEKMHKALLNMAELAASAQNINALYYAIHQQVKELVPTDNFFIALTHEQDQRLEFPYYVDEGVCHINGRHQAELITEQVVTIGLPLMIANQQLISLSTDGKYHIKPYQLKSEKGLHDQAWLATPLKAHGKIFGVLMIQCYAEHNVYQRSDLSIIRFIGQHIASAIYSRHAKQVTEQNNEELELLVAERTKELEATNSSLRLQIEERRKVESQLYFEAHHDALTRLPNRAMFTDRLSYALRHVKRHQAHYFAVLFIDLDRFKLINDTLGHQAGDVFLIEVAQRLASTVRDNDLLARLGGDEFVILLDSMQSKDDVEDIAARLIENIGQPFSIEGNQVHSSASVGIAYCTPDYQDASEILRDADAAMYQAKSLGRNRYVFFDDSMREQLLANMSLEQELRVAVKNQQFELHYQKIADLGLTNTLGFEVLLRWQHPTQGILTPSSFLSIAEETGLIVDIEKWLLTEVALQFQAWRHHNEYHNAYIAINLSGRYLSQPKQLNELIEYMRSLISEPQRLILEFNESAFMLHPELSLKSLKILKEFGVKLALDDYGAGMSSFNFLHNYPFEFIKLDRSFTRSLSADDKQLSLVKALLELGNNFGYRLVAEGIESEELLNKLKSVGCDFGQGYFINRPAKLVSPMLETQGKVSNL